MTNSVLKFPLVFTPTQSVMMPQGATMLSVQDQNGILCIWSLCDVNATYTSRKILIFATGETMILPNLVYIGTVQQGSFVWHVFEDTTP